jgi:hypothetical protein
MRPANKISTLRWLTGVTASIELKGFFRRVANPLSPAYNRTKGKRGDPHAGAALEGAKANGAIEAGDSETSASENGPSRATATFSAPCSAMVAITRRRVLWCCVGLQRRRGYKPIARAGEGQSSWCAGHSGGPLGRLFSAWAGGIERQVGERQAFSLSRCPKNPELPQIFTSSDEHISKEKNVHSERCDESQKQKKNQHEERQFCAERYTRQKHCFRTIQREIPPEAERNQPISHTKNHQHAIEMVSRTAPSGPDKTADHDQHKEGLKSRGLSAFAQMTGQDRPRHVQTISVLRLYEEVRSPDTDFEMQHDPKSDKPRRDESSRKGTPPDATTQRLFSILPERIQGEHARQEHA